VAGLPGPAYVAANADYLRAMGLESVMDKATHLIWATGGGMVPADEMARYLAKGSQSAVN
ncbi:MAG: D-serine dehydratase, partial [Pseudomonadota bacterium]